MSDITKAIAARQTQITQLQSEIETLQRAASIMGGGAKAPAKAAPEAKPQPTAKATLRKRQGMSAAQKKAVSKRMRAYWAKRKTSTAATTPAQPKATQKRTRKPMSAAAKRAMSKRLKASWAKRKRDRR